MSIIIKGMTKPTQKETFIRIDGNGIVKVYGDVNQYYRVEQLPPHGRLIEEPERLDLISDFRDVKRGLSRKIKYAKRRGENDLTLPMDFLENVLTALESLTSVRLWIEHAPTIIEAEGSDTDG